MGTLFGGDSSKEDGIIRETVRFSAPVRFYHNVETVSYPAHWHLPGEIIAPLDGSYDVVVDGKTLALIPGDVLIIAPGELHSLHAPLSGARYIMNFDTELLEPVHDMIVLFALLRPFCLVRGQEQPDLSKPLRKLLRRIEEEHDGAGPYWESAIFACLIEFFVLLGRSLAAETEIETDNGQVVQYTERFAAICGYINRHCAEDLSLETVAGQAGFSKYHFSRLFKRLMRTSFHEYLTDCRIAQAKKLLASASNTIAGAAMRSGFSSLSTFNRIFKREVGCTPSEYRRLHLGEGDKRQFS